MQSKRWCFTWNNAGQSRPAYNAIEMDYLVYQGEVGANGTSHVQGYVRFRTKRRLSAVKTLLGSDSIHVEIAKGTEGDNRRYCTKDEGRLWGPVEHGTFVEGEGTKGRRTDLLAATNMIKQGSTMKEVADQHSEVFVKYHQGLIQLSHAVRPLPPISRTVHVQVLWGPTRTGKTHRVLHTYQDIYQVVPGRDPWGLYKGQKVILFDEFDSSQWPITSMNRFLDKWRCPLDCRYHNLYAEWELVVICSNSSPESWYLNESYPLIQAFQRRLEVITIVESIDHDVVLFPAPGGEEILAPDSQLPTDI